MRNYKGNKYKFSHGSLQIWFGSSFVLNWQTNSSDPKWLNSWNVKIHGTSPSSICMMMISDILAKKLMEISWGHDDGKVYSCYSYYSCLVLFWMSRSFTEMKYFWPTCSVGGMSSKGKTRSFWTTGNFLQKPKFIQR